MSNSKSIVPSGYKMVGASLPFRFVVVGILNTAFSYVLLTIFLFVGCRVALATFLALALGICVSFQTQGAIVFRHRSMLAFVRFVGAWGFIYILNLLIMRVCMAWGWSAYVAGAIAIIPVTVVSYFVQKLVVFRPSFRQRPSATEGRERPVSIP